MTSPEIFNITFQNIIERFNISIEEILNIIVNGNDSVISIIFAAQINVSPACRKTLCFKAKNIAYDYVTAAVIRIPSHQPINV